MRLRLLLWFFLAASVFLPHPLAAQPQKSPASAPVQATYTLPPAKLRQAKALFRIETVLSFAGAAWGILQLLLLLALRVPPRLRNLAARFTRRHWLQGVVFTFLLLLLTAVLNLPIGLYGHHVGLAFGLSVQSWLSWFGDLGTGFLLDWFTTTLIVLLLFWMIRWSPRRWWLWFWLPAMAAVIFGVFLSPLIVDPLFNHFEPLAAHDPALVAQLEKVVARGPLHIPPDRMFLMRASAKYTVLNAYVTGIGPSKRVVVWDTTIAHATPDEISFIFAHEMGHYVLHHIYKTLVFAGLLMLIAFWVGFHIVQLLLRRYGEVWGIPSQQDWAALVVYLLVLGTLSFASQPLVNAYSRAHEHAADVYGQEAIHGVVPDPQRTAARAFQLLGETSLDDPTPHPFVQFWTGTHPTIAERMVFAAHYNPWLPGRTPRYFRR